MIFFGLQKELKGHVMLRKRKDKDKIIINVSICLSDLKTVNLMLFVYLHIVRSNLSKSRIVFKKYLTCLEMNK